MLTQILIIGEGMYR